MNSYVRFRDSHTDTSDESACWLWGGSLDRDGYGRYQPPANLAHRAAYIQVHGSIPKGLQIDHLCRTRSCVNPAHLEAVTPRVNTLRGNTLQAQNARKTECIHGHAYTPENTHLWQGKRSCKTCKRELYQRKAAKARGAA